MVGGPIEGGPGGELTYTENTFRTCINNSETNDWRSGRRLTEAIALRESQGTRSSRPIH